MLSHDLFRFRNQIISYYKNQCLREHFNNIDRGTNNKVHCKNNIQEPTGSHLYFRYPESAGVIDLTTHRGFAPHFDQCTLAQSQVPVLVVPPAVTKEEGSLC